ncbi:MULTISPECIES: DUF6884 domain-containing protein [Sphingomonadaceae]|jgi:hypothetical protein|uniref:DUF6884 domain-containing protein n=1 Tax=Sphingobium scionense TaxID=1404341 RepID=A0A7W6LXW2_9SPHN|nr:MULTISPECIES: DUF6884 domain-containing protein [Sphingomonadaceae]AMK26834.1 hypothetical protein K426_29715 [Sphingobium sp. TKS]MBB4151552.1 hypothetical protein [Sphingobium scionense]WRD78466.1 hypothetical protein QQ987_17975 [Sphingobium baderi]CDO34206.1 conserved hypothetical protein [Novosphingobium sp. KN65.2]|tara:strand:- start:511 stop:1131 length:621 start_codon:yes stop_codon:yes gene_type:complete
MARHCIREPRYVPPVQRIGEQPDLFGGPTLSHVAERQGPPKGWQRQLQKWGRCTVIADLEAAPPSVIDPPPSPSPVFLVACVAAKLDRPAPARDLYASPWFQKARAYVERQGGAWFILSAKHGLIAPETVIAPYDETLGAMKAGARRLWGARVIEAMAEQIDAAAPLIVLAGRNYRDPLWPQIERRASVPMEGLGIGQQLAWLSDN